MAVVHGRPIYLQLFYFENVFLLLLFKKHTTCWLNSIFYSNWDHITEVGQAGCLIFSSRPNRHWWMYYSGMQTFGLPCSKIEEYLLFPYKSLLVVRFMGCLVHTAFWGSAHSSSVMLRSVMRSSIMVFEQPPLFWLQLFHWCYVCVQNLLKFNWIHSSFDAWNVPCATGCDRTPKHGRSTLKLNSWTDNPKHLPLVSKMHQICLNVL